jgi:hypothetical protein
MTDTSAMIRLGPGSDISVQPFIRISGGTFIRCCT